MISRYANPEITRLFSNAKKYEEWQNVELAVLEARAEVGEISWADYAETNSTLRKNQIDEAWIDEEEKRSNHDYNAFIAERRRHLPTQLQRLFHGDMTSYDGEEPATSLIMKEMLEFVIQRIGTLEAVLENRIREYRFTPRLERTHGRGAEIQSVGRFFITLRTPLTLIKGNLILVKNGFDYSKLSGAIGSGGGLKPEVQRIALAKLGLNPFDGATQIMPRLFHSEAASALADLASWLEKMALDLWLGSRDPYPIFEEPFNPKQKGSSAMPWKKNPIALEKVRGMARLARSHASAIRENIVTPEGRDISQSSVERIAWPDLFHTVAHQITCMTKVVNGLNIYVDNLARQIAETRGTYAGSKAKELLAEWLGNKLDAEAIYRIVQIAGFNLFEPDGIAKRYRDAGAPKTLQEADKWHRRIEDTLLIQKPLLLNSDQNSCGQTMDEIIRRGLLRPSHILDIDCSTVDEWNEILIDLFRDEDRQRRWSEIFKPSYWLRNEEDQYKRVLGQ